ncbi:FAD-dependent oxidoreductase [Mesorhizobium sp. KR9-304]|uniref:dihydrolipoyl dehydrogenase family protein n=1 Tax=Mesorhizobium sp. KR9-304 TaxID=3156614 RepID=UPI0032B4CF73
MAKALTPDICVIGAGPGGIALATGAAAYGVKVVLVDNGATGDQNPNRRALAVSALIAAAKQAQAVRGDREFGIAEVEPEIDFKAVMARAREVAADAAPAFSPERLATLGVTVINAQARFTGRRRLAAGDTEIRARRFVLATGSTPVEPAIPGLNEIGCLTADTVFELGRRPGHLVIIGGEASGLELAQAFRRLGSQVTVIEASTVLADEDPEMASVVARRLRAEGVTIREGVKVTGVERRGKTSVRVLIETGTGAGEVDGSHLLVAVGRAPDIGTLDLKKARVALKGDAVDVSAMLRTTNRRIYAIGDVAGASPSTQMETYQAALVLKALLFRLPAKDRAIVPRTIHTDPELARAGLTEAQARRRHGRLTILRWPYAENDRARAERRQEGHIKLVASRRGEILGVTIAGANASELIGIWALALSKGLSLKDMASSIPPHPTMGEIGKNAAITYFAKRARRPLVRGMVRLLQLFG